MLFYNFTYKRLQLTQTERENNRTHREKHQLTMHKRMRGQLYARKKLCEKRKEQQHSRKTTTLFIILKYTTRPYPKGRYYYAYYCYYYYVVLTTH